MRAYSYTEGGIQQHESAAIEIGTHDFRWTNTHLRVFISEFLRNFVMQFIPITTP
jgi:hypothetical protein